MNEGEKEKRRERTSCGQGIRVSSQFLQQDDLEYIRINLDKISNILK